MNLKSQFNLYLETEGVLIRLILSKKTLRELVALSHQCNKKSKQKLTWRLTLNIEEAFWKEK